MIAHLRDKMEIPSKTDSCNRGVSMRDRLLPIFSVLLVIALGIAGVGAMRASSLHPSSARGGSTAEIQSDGQDYPVGQQGFIGYPRDVVTYHYSPTRLGQNTQESILTLSNVNSASFGKVGFFSVDGKVDAQPLYVYRLP